MNTVDCNACSVETPCQFVGEQNVPDLRQPIGRKLTIRPFALKVFHKLGGNEYARSLRSQIYDAALRGLTDQIQDQVRKQERCEMIDSKSSFYAINGVFSFCKSSAHVVNEHVNSGQLLMKTCAQLPNRGL